MQKFHKHYLDDLPQQCRTSQESALIVRGMSDQEVELADQALSSGSLTDVKAAMKAFVQSNTADDHLKVPGTQAMVKAAFFTLKDWLLEAQAADKTYTSVLQNQAKSSYLLSSHSLLSPRQLLV